MQAPVRWHRFPSAEQVAEQAARRIRAAAAAAIDARGAFRLVLAGGRTPQQCYRRLVGTDTDWSRWFVYFGDERCLPADHPERNSVMASRAWLEHVDIPAAQVYVIAAELGAEAAAGRYEEPVRAALPFDLVLAGMGEDGHTASLFPGRDWPPGRLVVAVHDAPKPPPDRVSLTPAALSATRQLMVLVTGESKRDAVTAWRKGSRLPVASLAAASGIDVLADTAAFPG